MASEIWDERFLRLAKEVGSWSKDPKTKVGAVIVSERNRVVSLGFNGFPRSIEDTQKRLENREEKLARTLHAEENAILFAERRTKGATIYTYPFPPCAHCAALIVQVGIIRVVSVPVFPERWRDSMLLGIDMFDEAKIDVDFYTEREGRFEYGSIV